MTPFSVTVTAYDGFDNIKTDYAGGAVLSGLANAPDSTAPSYGALTFTGGVATTSVTAVKAQALAQLTVTDDLGTVTTADDVSDDSNTFTVAPAADDHLVFDGQPSDVTAGEAINPAVAVGIYDQFGNLTHSTASVDLAVTGGTPTLFGTTSVAASDGTATFADLSIQLTGTYTLDATSGSLTGATSTSFTVNPAAATHLAFGVQPTMTVANQTITPAVTVRILDQFGNLVTPDNTTQVSLAFGSNPTSALLTGGAAQTATGGIATFSGLSVDKAGTGFTLVASSSPALTGATSSTFDITLRATLTTVSCATPVDAGATTSCTATVTDDNGAGATTPTGTVTFSSDGSGSFSPAATCNLCVAGTCSVDYTVPSGTLATTDHIGAHYNASPTHAASTATAFDLVIETHADLADLKLVDHGTIIAGDTLTYTITVDNLNGPSDAQGVYVVDTLPAGTTNARYCVPSLGPCVTELDFTPYTTGAHINLGTIVHGASKALYVKVDVLPSVADNTILTNSATVDATTPDPNAGNDTATAVTTVTGLADVSIDKSAPATVSADDQLTYTITVTNESTLTTGSTAKGISFSDTLQGDTPFVGFASTDGIICTGTLTITCTVLDLAPGASAVVTITVAIPTLAGTAIHNEATVSHLRHPRPQQRQRHRHLRHDGGAGAASGATTTITAARLGQRRRRLVDDHRPGQGPVRQQPGQRRDGPAEHRRPARSGRHRQPQRTYSATLSDTVTRTDTVSARSTPWPSRPPHR